MGEEIKDDLAHSVWNDRIYDEGDANQGCYDFPVLQMDKLSLAPIRAVAQLSVLINTTALPVPTSDISKFWLKDGNYGKY